MVEMKAATWVEMWGWSKVGEKVEIKATLLAAVKVGEKVDEKADLLVVKLVV